MTAPGGSSKSALGVSRLVLGVDGGGTKTTAWLAAVSLGRATSILGRGQAGSSNMLAVGQERALVEIESALAAAWSDSGKAPTGVDAAVLALAGSMNDEVGQAVKRWANRRQIAASVQLVHDAAPVLAAGVQADWGIALIAGTGSVALAVRPDEVEPVVVGGWGYRFGDEGSGYSIGRAALAAVAKSADGRGPDTALCKAALRQFEVDGPREIVPVINSTGDDRQAIGNFAPCVANCAESGDPIARDVLQNAADALTDLVTAAWSQAGFGEPFPLAMAGGVLCNCRIVREHVLRQIAQRGLRCSQSAVVAEPAAGCITLAARRLS